MANVRIKDLPQNSPIPSSWVVAEVMTTPGVFTTSKASLSTLVISAGLNYGPWQSTTSTMTATSAIWSNTTTAVNTSAGRWNSTYATVSSLSANWSAAYNSILSFKPLWDLGYTLGSSSYTTVRTNSGNWQAAGAVGVSTYTTVNANSASWNAGGGGAGSVYLTVNGLSAAWTSSTRSVTALSSRWDGAFTNLYPNSGNWNSAYTLLNTTTATTFLANNLSARDFTYATNFVAVNGPGNGVAWVDRNNSGYANQWYRANSAAYLYDNSPGAPNGGNLVTVTSAGSVAVAGDIQISNNSGISFKDTADQTTRLVLQNDNNLVLSTRNPFTGNLQQLLSVNTRSNGSSFSITNANVNLNNGGIINCSNVARAWAVFDGTQVNFVISSFNISSIIRTSTGVYTVTFASAMPSADYVVVGSIVGSAANYSGIASNGANNTTTSFTFALANFNSTLNNASRISIAVFGG